MAYTPGVARVCMAIHEDPDKVRALTIKQNSVAVVTDGTAVLGLGDIGPEAAMPVMEGQGDAVQGVRRHRRLSDVPGHHGHRRDHRHGEGHLAGLRWHQPRRHRRAALLRNRGRLRRELDIPVFHDDQHGTAVVVLAGLLNAARLVGKPLSELQIVLVGVGAAGVAVTKLLLEAGVTDIIGCDREGALHPGKKNLTAIKKWYARRTNPRKFTGHAWTRRWSAPTSSSAWPGRGAVSVDAVRSMADDAIVFAMANPDPEVRPEDVERQRAFG